MGNTSVYVTREPILLSIINNNYDNIEAYIFDDRNDMNKLKDYKQLIVDKINKYNNDLLKSIPTMPEFATGVCLASSGLIITVLAKISMPSETLFIVFMPLVLMIPGIAFIYSGKSGFLKKKAIEKYNIILDKINNYMNIL